MCECASECLRAQRACSESGSGITTSGILREGEIVAVQAAKAAATGNGIALRTQLGRLGGIDERIRGDLDGRLLLDGVVACTLVWSVQVALSVAVAVHALLPRAGAAVTTHTKRVGKFRYLRASVSQKGRRRVFPPYSGDPPVRGDAHQYSSVVEKGLPCSQHDEEL